MTLIQRYWGWFALVLAACLAVGELSVSRYQPVLSSASGETVTSQFERDIQDAIETLKSSRNLREWRTSGYTAADVINNTIALKRQDARNALCAALRPLPIEDLSVFETALLAPKAQQGLPCARELTEKIKTGWATQTEAADAARAKSEPGNLASGTKKIKADTIRDVSSELLENGEFVLVFEGNIDPLVTREILKTLDERNVKAVFLIPGNSARDHADVVETMSRIGEALGSQSTELQDLTLLPTSVADRVIGDGAHAVEVAGRVGKALLFSYPFGASNEPLESIVAKKGLKPVRPDFDTEDWKTYNAARLTEIVRKRLSGSSKGILLFHSGLRQTAIALPAILDELAASHRRVVTLDVK